MQIKTIRKFKLFAAWQDEKEEAWLTRMAREGLHLTSLGFPGFYYFEQGEPRNDVYRLDFLTYRRDWKNYLQVFKDAGWEHIGKMGGWQYFRTHAPEGETPEIYTDDKSKSIKYGRLLLFLVILFPLLTNVFIRRIRLNTPASIFLDSVKIFLAVFLLFYVFALIMIFRRFLKLRGKNR